MASRRSRMRQKTGGSLTSRRWSKLVSVRLRRQTCAILKQSLLKGRKLSATPLRTAYGSSTTDQDQDGNEDPDAGGQSSKPPSASGGSDDNQGDSSSPQRKRQKQDNNGGAPTQRTYMLVTEKDHHATEARTNTRDNLAQPGRSTPALTYSSSVNSELSRANIRTHQLDIGTITGRVEKWLKISQSTGTKVHGDSSMQTLQGHLGYLVT
jgi:hypothetical protein